MQVVRFAVFAAATLILLRKGKEKGIYLMAITLGWELVTAPIFWLFWREMNQEFVWLFTKWSSIITSVLFAGGLLWYATERNKKV